MYGNASYQSMYAQPGGAGGGLQWDAAANNDNQSPAALQGQGQYTSNGYSQPGQGQGPPSSASLFQQQLAHQQRSAQNAPNPLAQQHAGGNSYQSSAQAYMQSQQQLAQARQGQIPPQPSNSSSFPASAQSPAPSSSQLPPSAPHAPSYPSQHLHDQPQQPQQQQQQQRQMSGPEIMSIIRGVNIQTMNPQVFATLTPIQQYAVREYIQRSRIHQAQQQAQLGLGLPGSPASPPAQKPFPSSQNPASGSPAPLPATVNRPQQIPQSQGGPTQASQIGFLRILGDFCMKRGISLSKSPVVDGRTIELPRLYAAVNATGGFMNTNGRRQWGTVATALGFPASSAEEHPDERLQQIASAYHSVLFPFEQHVAQMQLQRIQAARAAAGQTAASPITNGTPPSTAMPPPNAQMPSHPSTSYPSPIGAQNNLAPQSSQTSTPPVTTQSPRPSSSTSATAPLAGFSAKPRQLDFDSKIPSPLDARPNGVSNRRDSIAMGNIKGKGRAMEDQTMGGPVKSEDFAANVTTTPRNQASLLPDMTISASPRPLTGNASKPTASPLPEPINLPPRRKRQKIEYVASSKAQDTIAGYDLAGVEEVVHHATRRKRPRTAYDLGLVDLHSLTMSLRSRLASEVSFALNSLTLISMSIRTHPQESNSIPFPLSRCRNLYDEIVDLLEETAFGFDDDDDDDDDHDPNNEATSVESPPGTYSDLFQLITEEAGQLVDSDPDERNRIAQLADSGHTPLKPIDILLAVTNILRNLSITEENSSLMGQDQHLVEVLARVANLPLKQATTLKGKGTVRWPVRVAPLDSMTLKKDVLEMIVNFGVDIRLEDHDTATARSLFELLSFFLLDAHKQSDVYFDLSKTPGTASRILQPSSVRIAHYVDLGLAAFAQIALIDSNRTIISRLTPSPTLERLFDSLIRLVPMSEPDFQILTHESGLIHVQNLIMSLYNLVYLSPPELKLELRTKPAYVRSLMRVVRRLSGTGASDAAATAFQPLIERCVSILQLLSTLEGVTVGSGGMESSEVPWWGLSMSGFEEEDEGGRSPEDGKPRVRRAQPTESDRGTVKQKLPPSASTAAGLDPGLPILSGETKALFESLDNKSMVNVFASLVTLL